MNRKENNESKTHLSTVHTVEGLPPFSIMNDGVNVQTFLALKQLATLKAAEVLAVQMTLHVVAKSLGSVELTSTYLRDKEKH